MGHNETGNSLQVILDSDMGFIDLVLGEPKYRAEDADLWNITVLTPFTLSTFDNYDDVDFTWYTIDGDYNEGTTFTLSSYDEGLRTVTFGTMDLMGTSETWDTIFVYLDDSSPNSELSLGDPKYREMESDPWKVTWDTLFTVSSQDEYSGVALIWFTINGDYEEGTGFDLGIFADGEHVITWGALDNLDFNETGNQITVILENSPPDVTITVGSPNSTVNDVLYITSKTEFTLTFEDNEPTTIYYSFDGGGMIFEYTSPFTVTRSTTEIMFWGEDVLENKANRSNIEFVVNDKDTDDDGIEDLIDDDDDNDGLKDYEEDLNQNGIMDEDESDPLNADTDSDGYIDSKDKYPQDDTKYRDPTNWEKVPFFGQYEQGLCINLLIIGLILLVVLIYLFRRYRMFRAKSSWKEEAENNQELQNNE
jgi:hypothetical protein